MNYRKRPPANTMSRAGVSRVVLARELGIEEIREIKARTSCELDVFVARRAVRQRVRPLSLSSFLGASPRTGA
jgi:putative protease